MKTLNTTGSRQCCLKEKVMLWPLFGPWHVWLFRQELGKCGLGWVKDNKLFSHKKKYNSFQALVAPKNGKCDFPTLQGTPFLLSPDIQQANRAPMVLQRNNQDQTCSCHFSNSLANPGSRKIRKILLSFLNYQQIEIQLTMTVSTL